MTSKYILLLFIAFLCLVTCVAVLSTPPDRAQYGSHAAFRIVSFLSSSERFLNKGQYRVEEAALPNLVHALNKYVVDTRLRVIRGDDCEKEVLQYFLSLRPTMALADYRPEPLVEAAFETFKHSCESSVISNDARFEIVAEAVNELDKFKVSVHQDYLIAALHQFASMHNYGAFSQLDLRGRSGVAGGYFGSVGAIAAYMLRKNPEKFCSSEIVDIAILVNAPETYNCRKV